MVYDLWDCVTTIPPYPHYIGERGDGYDVASVISYPDIIFFRCILRPINATKGRYNCYSEDIDVGLFFFIRKTLMLTCFFDGASQGSRGGRHVYEINTWLWNFGRPQPRDFWSPKPKRSAGIPGPKRLGALGRPGRPGSVQPPGKIPAEVI
jgi:hypothetical protein